MSELSELTFTLLCDGSSDSVLIPILKWLVRRCGFRGAVNDHWIDGAKLGHKKPLERRIVKALELYPCELLFIHRDAEKEPQKTRRDEIEHAIAASQNDIQQAQAVTVCVVPVRMTEAWLLFDERAIRRASGNPNGTAPLHLPKPAQWEVSPDPKSVLHEALRVASGLRGRRLESFQANQRQIQIPQCIEDFSPLLTLKAFQGLKDDTTKALAERVRRAR
jgi:hypothetical protein